MSKLNNFPYPTTVPANIWECSLFRRSVVMLGSAESKKLRLISREIIFWKIQTYMITIRQCYRQTDGQLALAIPRSSRLHTVIARHITRRVMLLMNDMNHQLTHNCTYMGTLFDCCVLTCTFVALFRIIFNTWNWWRMFCHSCGTSVPETTTAKYCINCGCRLMKETGRCACIL